MTLLRRSILPAPLPMGSSGDGASSPSQVDPVTGQPNSSYEAPQPSAPLAADNGGDASTRAHLAALAADHRRASARSSAIAADGSQGSAGVALGPDTFSVTGSTPDGSNTTTGGTDPLVTRTDGADDGTQFGKALG